MRTSVLFRRTSINLKAAQGKFLINFTVNHQFQTLHKTCTSLHYKARATKNQTWWRHRIESNEKRFCVEKTFSTLFMLLDIEILLFVFLFDFPFFFFSRERGESERFSAAMRKALLRNVCYCHMKQTKAAEREHLWSFLREIPRWAFHSLRWAFSCVSVERKRE